MSSSNLPSANRPKFSVAISQPSYQKLISNTLGDPNRARRFVAAISSAVAVNPALQECTAGSILSGALLGESLNLSPSPQLGQYYLVPFKSKAKMNKATGELIEPECTKATFVLGYKGYIQLALRSGYYADLDAVEIKRGEYLGKDPSTGKPKFKFIEDDEARETLETVGYMAYFEYLNGFKKVMYWSKEKMLAHADKYSKAFNRDSYVKILNHEIADKDMWKYSSFWYTDFDGMAKKTMLRQLISHWGIMSIEMQTAFEKDNTFIQQNENGDFISNEPEALPQSQVESAAEIIPESTDAVPKVDLNNL